MKSVFVYNNAEPPLHIKAKGRLRKVLETEDQLKNAINLGFMDYYVKLEGVQVGSYVVCCNRKDSMTPNFGQTGTKGGGHRQDMVFKIKGFDMSETECVVRGSDYGSVFINYIRLATKEEVEKEHKKKGYVVFDPLSPYQAC